MHVGKTILAGDTENLLGEDLVAMGRRGDARSVLAQKFELTPFSILDSMSETWQARKKKWIRLGLKSDVGRNATVMDDSKSSVYNGNSKWAGYHGPKTEASERGEASSVSVFDPVLCELMLSWFCPAGGRVLDPFSGGSVRGIVASALGLHYTGIDLSAEQVTANRASQLEAQAASEAAQVPLPGSAVWAVGDSTKQDAMLGLPAEVDMVFTCPPYGDHEPYSTDPADLSNMTYENFLVGYRTAIKQSCARLKPNRFAAFVVGDFRGPDTCLRGFPADTIMAFRDAGLKYYNDGVLATAIGSLGIRTSYLWPRGRKLGRRHQEVLVFLKGDWKLATEAVRTAAEAAKVAEQDAAR